MRSYKLIWYILSILTLCVHCAPLTSPPGKSSDADEVYSVLFKEFFDSVDRKTLYVRHTTRSSILNEFRFDDPRSHTLDTISLKTYHSQAWKDFLSNIDLKSLQNTELKKNPFRSAGKKIVFLSPAYPKPTFVRWFTTISVSPVIISPDGQMALVGIDTYSDPEAAGGYVAFFEKRMGKWVMVENIMLYIS